MEMINLYLGWTLETKWSHFSTDDAHVVERVFSFLIHEQAPSINHMVIHLKNGQRVFSHKIVPTTL